MYDCPGGPSLLFIGSVNVDGFIHVYGMHGWMSEDEIVPGQMHANKQTAAGMLHADASSQAFSI